MYKKEKQSPVGVVWDDVVTVLDAGLTGEKCHWTLKRDILLFFNLLLLLLLRTP